MMMPARGAVLEDGNPNCAKHLIKSDSLHALAIEDGKPELRQTPDQERIPCTYSQ